MYYLYHNKYKLYKEITFNRIIKNFTGPLSKFLFGQGSISIGLILGEIAGQFISVIIIIKSYFQEFKKYTPYISKSNIMSVARKYKHFPIYN